MHQTAFSQTIDAYYINMPDALNPTLSKQNRLELIEYFKAGKGDSITNRFGNQARIICRDTLQQRLVIQNTANSTFEMMVIKSSETSNLIGLIRTICGPVCNSAIGFYNTNWNAISLQFKTPKASEWLNTDSLAVSSVDKKWVENTINDSFISLSFSSEKQEIEAQNNILDFLSDADRKVIAPLLINNRFSYRLTEKNWVKN
jgi:hypothetical protein